MTPSPTALERVAAELLDTYAMRSAPIPIEAILQQPMPDMWESVDMAELSGTFYAMTDPFGPRLALARLLVRLLAGSTWGARRGLTGMDMQPSAVYRMARAILMPRALIAALPAAALTPVTVSALFEVPLAEAERRLRELDAMPEAD